MVAGVVMGEEIQKVQKGKVIKGLVDEKKNFKEIQASQQLFLPSH